MEVTPDYKIQLLTLLENLPQGDANSVTTEETHWTDTVLGAVMIALLALVLSVLSLVLFT